MKNVKKQKYLVYGVVSLWDLNNGNLIHTFDEHTGYVYALSFSPDGETLASGSHDKTIRIWNVTDRKTAQVIDDTGYVQDIEFSPNGVFLASASGGNIELWNTDDWSMFNTILAHSNDRVNAIKFSPDGKSIASSSLKEVRIWNVSNGGIQKNFNKHTSWVDDVEFSPDGNLLASAGDDEIQLWDINGGVQIQSFIDIDGFDDQKIAFSPNGSTLVSISYDGTIRSWQVSNGTTEKKIEGLTSWVKSITFSPDGNTLASGSYSRINLFEVYSGNILYTFMDEVRGWVNNVIFSPDGTILAAKHVNISLWDFSNKKKLFDIEEYYSGDTISFSKNGDILATIDSNEIVLWDIESKTILKSFKNTLFGYSNDIEFSPDGNLLAVADDDIYILSSTDGEIIRTLEGHTDDINQITFSPDGSMLASVSEDNTLRLWSVSDGKTLYTIEGENDIRSVVFSPDGTIIAASTYELIYLWRSKNGHPIKTLKGHTSWINSIEFSPNGTLLASGSYDGTTRLWGVDPNKAP